MAAWNSICWSCWYSGRKNVMNAQNWACSGDWMSGFDIGSCQIYICFHMWQSWASRCCSLLSISICDFALICSQHWLLLLNFDNYKLCLLFLILSISGYGCALEHHTSCWLFEPNFADLWPGCRSFDFAMTVCGGFKFRKETAWLHQVFCPESDD